jgi:hypothetical protein
MQRDSLDLSNGISVHLHHAALPESSHGEVSNQGGRISEVTVMDDEARGRHRIRYLCIGGGLSLIALCLILLAVHLDRQARAYAAKVGFYSRAVDRLDSLSRTRLTESENRAVLESRKYALEMRAKYAYYAARPWLIAPQDPPRPMHGLPVTPREDGYF